MTSVAEATTNVASTLIDALIASNRGDRHAFAFGQKRYSYQDVAALMNRTGNMLKTKNVSAGKSVLILLPGSPAFVASVLGAIKAGAVPVVGGTRMDANALQVCLDATKPSAVIVHQDLLAAMAGSLSGVPVESVIVVGNDAQGHTSFLEAIRSQSSWLSAETVGGDARAIGWWTSQTLRTLSHAQLAAVVEADLPASDAKDEVIAASTAMLRAFSRGAEATLPTC